MIIINILRLIAMFLLILFGLVVYGCERVLSWLFDKLDFRIW